jgi:hypothetical protein
LNTKNFLQKGLIISTLLLSNLVWSASASSEHAIVSSNANGNILYVKPDAPESGTCSSWADACRLQSALGAAIAGNEIRVAAGVYYPGSAGDARTVTFQLKDGVALYGGFAGNESSREQRDWMENLTILSGDIDGDGTLSGNAYHVVSSSVAYTTTVLDGFSITAGNANSVSNPDDRGGGIYNNGGSPTLINVTFYGNNASSAGGGMATNNGSPIMTNVNFSGNSAQLGGAMYNTDNSPTLTNVTFYGNSASFYGGGMYNFSANPTLINATFYGNDAVISGGGMYNYSSSLTLTNATFYGNDAVTGGGIDCESGSSTLTNDILWGNTPDQISGSANVTYSDIQDGYAGISNINIYPMFVDSASGNLRLLPFTAAIDSGNNSAVPPNVTTDLDGSPRMVDYTGKGTSVVDMGAYEAQVESMIIYVDKDAPGAIHDGTSWVNAFTGLQAALAAANGINEIWVAKGVYYPGLNGNRLATFLLRDNVALFGGFDGSETAREQRSGTNNHTLLSGDIDHNGELGGNAYHVVTSRYSNSTAVLDSFTITAGNDERTSDPYTIGVGGGMYNISSSPTLTNLTFSGNQAVNGGGMFNNYSNPTLRNITFSGNSASDDGGGMYNYILSNPSLTNVTFSGNSAQSDGSGMANTNSNPTLTSVILWGNTPTLSQIYNSSSTPVVTYSDVQGGYSGVGNINADPLLGALADNGGSTFTHALLAGSPAIDAGSPTCPPPDTDQRGVRRPIDGDGDGEAICDMGSFEAQSNLYLPIILKP